MRVGVYQNILRFNVSVADTNGMNVGNRSNELIRIEFDEKRRNHLLHFHVLLHDSVQCVGNKIHHHVQIYLIWLLSVCVEELTHLDAVGMMKSFENLEFTVLVALILEHFFNSHCLTSFRNCCLEYDTERTVSNNFLRIVSQTLHNVG